MFSVQQAGHVASYIQINSIILIYSYLEKRDTDFAHLKMTFFFWGNLRQLWGCLNFIALSRQDYKMIYRGHKGPRERGKRKGDDLSIYLKAKTKKNTLHSSRPLCICFCTYMKHSNFKFSTVETISAYIFSLMTVYTKL